MPFANGVFKRLYSWQADAAAGKGISPVEFDQDGDDVATALSNTILRDGTGLPTADTPWNGKKITFAGAATNAGDVLSIGGTPSSAITDALGYVPARANTVFSAFGNGPSDLNSGSRSYLTTVDFTATASGALIVAGGTWQNTTSGSGSITVTFGLDLLDTVTNAVVRSAIEAFAGVAYTTGPAPMIAVLAVTGLTPGRIYRARIYASKVGTNAVTPGSNLSISGVNL